ncbi:phosphotransferase enzyme family protein [Trichophyton equinum CBS 127.97]|uniref:Altered inheritance of mitochondria protein 9, mitochondrial n=1 Tax=Trichophyton equinum (strain ATCC MYA-4606 / CBS 127.97) TaxID=559882 RepID=F2Q1Q4_TRIEC|nr:phosphotransferase enzyme family protein [Trichophyton equinum CBS 127.97]
MDTFRRRSTLIIHDLLVSTRLGQKQPFSTFPCRTKFHSRPQTTSGNKEYHNHDFLFQYTSGRWLWGEEEQLAARYVKFDVAALCQVAADAVGARSCTDITKLPEGNFNKVLLLTMDDGKEVIAKIPNPNAGHPHFVTSSEVATMDFVRNRLHIPAPKVYSWCSDASKSKVDVMQKSKIVENIVLFEKSLALSPFSSYGSLYYADGDATEGIPESGFTMVLHNIVDMVLNRDYIEANATRERESITSLGSSPRLQGINGPDLYQPSQTAKLRALDLYLSISKYLLPKNKETHKGVLWHPDLHTDNIFVDPQEPTKITCLIDWQAVHIAPLFLQARRPAFLDFDGPIPERLKFPSLPENFDDMQPEEKLNAKKLRDEQALYILYEIELLRQCRAAGSALHGRDTLATRLTGLAGSVFTDGEPVVLGYLIRVVDRWGEIVGKDATGDPVIPCPITFTDAERTKQRIDQQKWEKGVELMDDVVQSLGVYTGWDGFVSHDDYEIKKQQLIASRDAFLQSMAGSDEERRAKWRKAWPFPVS